MLTCHNKIQLVKSVILFSSCNMFYKSALGLCVISASPDLLYAQGFLSAVQYVQAELIASLIMNFRPNLQDSEMKKPYQIACNVKTIRSMSKQIPWP